MIKKTDVLIVGGGVVGCAILRELTLRGVEALLVEKEHDLAEGISKANSGVIHAGFNVKTGSLKAQLNIEGLRLLPCLADELAVSYRFCGKLVIASGKDGLQRLNYLLEQGVTNGSQGLSVISGIEAKSLVPGVQCDWALLSENTGIINPYIFTIALGEDAVKRGAEIHLGSTLTGVEKIGDLFKCRIIRKSRYDEGRVDQEGHPAKVSSTKASVTKIRNNSEYSFCDITSKMVINCAGLAAGVIAGMPKQGREIPVYPCRGEYHVLDKIYGDFIPMAVYPLPNADGSGLGVHLTPTMEGNVLIGPSAEYLVDIEGCRVTGSDARKLSAVEVSLPWEESAAEFPGMTANTDMVMKQLLDESAELVPELEGASVIKSYSGLRPKLFHSDSGEKSADFVIEEAPNVPGLINLIGIESPGLTASPAIARYVADILVKKQCKNNKVPKETRPSIRSANSTDKEIKTEKRMQSEDETVLCRCEGVTIGDIRRAMSNSAGAKTLNSLKKRTRAMSGRCQSGFCLSRITDLLINEYGMQPEEICQNKSSSNRYFGYIDEMPVSENTWKHLLSEDNCVSIIKKPDLNIDVKIADLNNQDIPLKVKVAVIGAGPAGLAAAIELRKRGVENLVVIDRNKNAGGILNQCIHPGFGLHIFKKDLTGPQYALELIKQARQLNIEILLDTMVLDVSEQNLKLSSPDRGRYTLKADAVILATGCRERTRENLMIPGTRPAGIFSAGQAQHLINCQGLKIGSRVVIQGSGDVGLIMARRLALEGYEVVAVLERLPYLSGLIRNKVQCLDHFNIPLYLNSSITEISGDERVEKVKVSSLATSISKVNAQLSVDSKRCPDTFRCDTVLFAVGLIPELELFRSAGGNVDKSGHAVGSEAPPWLFVSGNARKIHDLADWASMDGFETAEKVVNYLAYEKNEDNNSKEISSNEKKFDSDFFAELKNSGKTICIICPRGCQINRNSDVVSGNRVEGAGCRKGVEYIEMLEKAGPSQKLTTTMALKKGDITFRIPVISSREIAVRRLSEIINALRLNSDNQKMELFEDNSLEMICLKNLGESL